MTMKTISLCSSVRSAPTSGLAAKKGPIMSWHSETASGISVTSSLSPMQSEASSSMSLTSSVVQRSRLPTEAEDTPPVEAEDLSRDETLPAEAEEAPPPVEEDRSSLAAKAKEARNKRETKDFIVVIDDSSAVQGELLKGFVAKGYTPVSCLACCSTGAFACNNERGGVLVIDRSLQPPFVCKISIQRDVIDQ